MKHIHSKSRHSRRGLAPLELVLWLPILLFVMALMMNFGTAAAWRVRGEIMARDAVWRAKHHDDANPDLFPEATLWPDRDASSSKQDDSALESLSDRSFFDGADNVIRGPLGIDVTDIFNPDIEGAYQGRAQIEREPPFLPSLGNYNSGAIRHPMLERMWQSSEYGYGDYNSLPHVGEFLEFGVAQSIGHHNWLRRSTVLYEWEDSASGLEAGFDRASSVASAYESSNSAALRVMYGEDQWTERFQKYYTMFGGGPWRPDFYPKPPGISEWDRETVRQRAVEYYLIDVRESDGRIRLGGITQLHRSLTSGYRSFFQRARSNINRMIEILENVDPQTPQIAQQIVQLEADRDVIDERLAELAQYAAMFEQIDEALRQNSPAT